MSSSWRASTSQALLLLVAIASRQVQALHYTQYFSPIQQRLGMVHTAAHASLAVYTGDDAKTNDNLWIVRDRTGEKQKSAVQWTQDDDYCYFAFRGGEATQGFEWVSDINLKVSYVQTLKNPRKKCRVVREYYHLQHPKKGRTTGRYHTNLIDAVQQCVAESKHIVLTGHDVGGAIATIWAVALHKHKALKRPPQGRRRAHEEQDGEDESTTLKYSDLWVIAFGSPPVFSPLMTEGFDQIAPGELTSKAGHKRPCKFIEYEKTVQFVNTEYELYVDFMYSLNALMYAMMQNTTSSYHQTELAKGQLDCLTQGAQHVQRFFEKGGRGNLGSPYGQFVFLGPSRSTMSIPADEDEKVFYTDSTLEIYHSHVADSYKLSFDNSFYNINATWLLLPDACRTTTIDGDVDFASYDGGGDVHRMESYVAKLHVMSPKWSVRGYHPFHLCTPGFKCSASASAMEMRRRRKRR